MSIAIHIVTFAYYDFLVTPLIYLIDKFWENHPPIYVSGTKRKFTNAMTIPSQKNNENNWVSNYLYSINYLLQEGYNYQYLCLDDLHPIGNCNSEYLNIILPKYIKSIGAGYINLMGYFPLLKTTPSKNNDFLEFIPNTDYNISLQVGLWNLQYAQSITQSIINFDISSIWEYETKGSHLTSIIKKNLIIKNNTHCIIKKHIEKQLQNRYANHISFTPYPFVRGGFLYQGRSTNITRYIYTSLFKNDPVVMKMISHTQTIPYITKNFMKRIIRRSKFEYSKLNKNL